MKLLNQFLLFYFLQYIAVVAVLSFVKGWKLSLLYSNEAWGVPLFSTLLGVAIGYSSFEIKRRPENKLQIFRNGYFIAMIVLVAFVVIGWVVLRKVAK
jgi:cbb3-type cytochrome oxidase subunit 1